MKTASAWIVLSLISLSVAACGGSEGTCADGIPASTDPRCRALCISPVPPIMGSGEVCSAASSSQCVSLCEKQIEAASSICASCLLERSYLTGAGMPPSPSWLTFKYCPELSPGGSSGTTGVNGWEHTCRNDSGMTTCTIKSPSQSRCDYSFLAVASCSSKIAEDCFRTLAPRIEVACLPRFRSTTECASVCK